ncbi:nucleotidyltransferase family protein [Candidatus Pacearchaeota archaeon]|nr:nucleotidyltransferase family protein [Candidatus Pacearchaeota archaeon]
MENKTIENIKKKIIPILKKNNVVRAGIFGSYARGEQKKNSDIDILIKTSKPLGFKFAGIQFEIEKKINKKVDLLTYNSIHPLLRKRILKEEVRII